MDQTRIFAHASAIDADVGLAMHAARAAGQVIQRGYGTLNQVEQKDVGDLVSQVDHDADWAASVVLRRESNLPILSEELNSETVRCDRMWIVDPLDASSAFLMQAGREYPAVLIALREDDHTTLGVVYFPLTEQWYYARRGRGAWRNGRRLICDRPAALANVWVEMNQYGNAAWETTFFADLRSRLRSREGASLVTCGPPNSGVAMRIANGEGRLAAAIHDNNPVHVKQAAWDIAAPQVILEEAGGVFLNARRESANPFVAEPLIVAQSKAIAHQIIDLGIAQTART